jgi:F-type H+-transporting ATPase subunit a
MRRRSVLGLLLVAALAFPSAAFAKGEFDPSEEWNLHDWVPIHLGPLNLSINKAVAFLLLGAALSCLIGIGLMRIKVGSKTGRRQALGEQIYEIAQVQVAEQGLPHKAIRLWFPYVATLMIFIWSVNILGFVPLPRRPSRSSPPPRRSR